MEYNVHVRIYSARLRGKIQKSIQDSPPGRILQPQINASALPGGFQPQDWLGKIGFNLELMSVNDIPRNSFNDMEKEGPPPEYSPSCSNNGGHPNDVYGDGVVTADIVQEHS